MKYVYEEGDPKHIWFLTNDMLRALKSVSIKYEQLSDINSLIGKLYQSEIVHFYALQDVIAGKLGIVKQEDVFHDVEDPSIKALLTTALNSADRNSLLEFVNKRNKFYVHGVKNGFVICILSKDDAEEPISWDPLVSSTLPSALLESIYQKIGYLESHPKPVTKAKVDEFCLADVFKLIAVS